MPPRHGARRLPQPSTALERVVRDVLRLPRAVGPVNPQPHEANTFSLNLRPLSRVPNRGRILLTMPAPGVAGKHLNMTRDRLSQCMAARKGRGTRHDAQCYVRSPDAASSRRPCRRDSKPIMLPRLEFSVWTCTTNDEGCTRATIARDCREFQWNSYTRMEKTRREKNRKHVSRQRVLVSGLGNS